MANFYIPKKKIKKTGKQQSLTIDRLDQKFQGIGYFDKKVIFVPGALPGEEVVMQVTNSHKKYSTAKLISVTKPSPLRITPSCPHYHECGGCQTQYVENTDQLSLKQLAIENRMRYLADDCQWQSPITSPDWGYRRRARIGVHVNKRGDLALGFRQRASNDLVNITQCPVLVEPFQALFTPLTQLVEQLKARDKVGHLEFIAPDNGLFIIIRLLTQLLAEDRALLATFSGEHQLTFLIEDNDGNILDLAGKQPSPLYYQLNGDTLAFNAGDFIQINAQVNQKMVDQAVDWLELKTTDKVLDLFCGIGNFSLSIAKQSQLVVGVEGVKEMVEQASRNALAAGLSNISFYHSDLSQPLADQAWYSRKLGEQVDKILLDPARDGAMAIVEQLSKLKPSIIVYVSCEPSSLERDSKVIINQGYKLEKMCVMDMFPQTTHLESMALFRKI